MNYEPIAGTHIEPACKEAIALAVKSGEAVVFKFNDIQVTAQPTSDWQQLASLWRKQMDDAAKAYRESPEGIAAAARAEDQKRDERRRRERFAALNISITIQQGREQEYADWKTANSHDGYSQGVVDFAERWAFLMEKEIPDGTDGIATEVIQAHAKQLSHEADIDGITGFMYGCAVQALAYFWIYGEELRRWHNLDTQIGDEGERANRAGGVLNPAILSVEV